MSADRVVRFGVLGGRSTIANQAVLPAIEVSHRCQLVASAARSGPVPERWRSTDAGSYEAVVGHPDVEVVYLPLANGLHAEWAMRAAEAGKHVLCEKPLAPTSAEAERMLAAGEANGVVVAEAWMTPFSPRWQRTLSTARDGTIGEVRHVRADFTFKLGDDRAGDYRFDPAQGGGALLDVGIYALGPALSLWGPAPTAVAASITRTPTGVDATTIAQLDWGGGRTAEIVVSIEQPHRQRLEYLGTKGRAIVAEVAHTNPIGAPPPVLEHDGEPLTEPLAGEDADPYQCMVDAMARAVSGEEPWPRSPADTLAVIRLYERILAAGAGN